MDLPTGTITFLFTDIEGSTKLWEEHPEAMRSALARHNFLLRSAIQANSGSVFKTVGDAFCAAFATAPDALNAALTAQSTLLSEFVEGGLSLRVRMALHTGTAELRDGDYFGQTLNRVARLLEIGHGKQCLLSQTTYDLTRDTLPPSASLKPLGEHRLRDVGRPETVFQLLHPELPADFPPLRSLDNPDLPNNLPQQVTSFIGREKEIAQVKRLLEATHLLTLTGSGGCGKTRLALQVAADLLDQFADGVWVAQLAPLSDPALVSQTVASVLSIKEEPGKPLVQTLVEKVKTKHLLLVLDNCEHLLSACIELANTMIRSCPHVTVLITSQEPLGIAGETTYRIPSLSLPACAEGSTPESLSQYEAVRLFIERATDVVPTFTVTNANAPALAQICSRLDGIPLALELAAARVRSLPLEQFSIRLDDCFRLLTGGSRTALARHQTLRALIDWSYSLLTEQECLLLRRLSVFVGGWTLEAAEAVCVGDVIQDCAVLDLLTSLADKSLVIYSEQAGQARYRLLETVRQYAGERLKETEELADWQVRHSDYFLALAEQAEPHLQGPEQAAWYERLEREHDNLRAALACYVAATENATEGLRLSKALVGFWEERGHLSEGRRWYTAVLSHPDTLGHTKARADALSGAGRFAFRQGDYASASAYFKESLAIKRGLSDQQGIASSLHNLGLVAYCQGDYATAKVLHEESLCIRRELENKRPIAESLEVFASLAAAHGQAERAARLSGAAEALRQAIGFLLAPKVKAEHARKVSTIRAALGEEAFAAAWEEGRALTWEQAVAYALEAQPDRELPHCP